MYSGPQTENPGNEAKMSFLKLGIAVVHLTVRENKALCSKPAVCAVRNGRRDPRTLPNVNNVGLKSCTYTHIQAEMVETYSPLDISRNPSKIGGRHN